MIGTISNWFYLTRASTNPEVPLVLEVLDVNRVWVPLEGEGSLHVSGFSTPERARKFLPGQWRRNDECVWYLMMGDYVYGIDDFQTQLARTAKRGVTSSGEGGHRHLGVYQSAIRRKK